MKIGLYLHPRLDAASEVLRNLIQFLQEQGHDLYIPDYQDGDLLRQFPGLIQLAPNAIAAEVETMFSIGGDGTFLGAAHLMVRQGKPVLGIHLGGLGFLADVTVENFKERLSDFFDGKYRVEERRVLRAVVEFERRQEEYLAFNDFVIDKGRSLSMIKIRTHVDDEYLNTYRADGLIISTPTGSTAYSLSAGGPIIAPHLNVVTISPICPHSLSARPVLLSGDQKVRIDCRDFGSDVALVVDGQKSIALREATRVSIMKADLSLKIVRFEGDSFFQTLRTKMNWGLDARGN
jgi:NAD+ kinase